MTDIKRDENIAAIAFVLAGLGSDTLYATPAGRRNGMAGIYSFAAAAGRAFSDAEALFDPDYDTVDWYLALDAYAAAIIATDTHDHASLVHLADMARQRNSK